MLHHVSLNVRDPEHVAARLGYMFSAKVLRAPRPPFPFNSWFVCFGDENGSLIEVLPWGEVRDPTGRAGIAHDDQMRPHSGWHVLLSTHMPIEHVIAVAGHEGWHCETTHAGLFQFVKVWIENAALIEVMSAGQAAHYVSTFGVSGLVTLAEKLQSLESGKT
jgi:hypothetical protein